MEVKFSVNLRGDNGSAAEIVRNSLDAGATIKICSKHLSKNLIEYTILVNNKFRFIGTCQGFNGACLGWIMEVLK